MIELLKAANYKKMLWKNGQGYTFEIARSTGEDLAHFDWRISMADVKTAGHFSTFQGMQRILTVLEGQGISLCIDDDVKQLTELETVSFHGESDVNCQLTNGMIRDFNLIYNPEKFHICYQWITEHTDLSILSSANILIVFNQNQAPLNVKIDQQMYQVDHQDCLKITNNKRLINLSIDAQKSQKTCLIELIQK